MSADTRTLVEAAIAGVVVEVCRRCCGWGVVGLTTFPAPCPDCRGCGRTTTNEATVDDE